MQRTVLPGIMASVCINDDAGLWADPAKLASGKPLS
jgi:hypothetical protein